MNWLLLIWVLICLGVAVPLQVSIHPSLRGHAAEAASEAWRAPEAIPKTPG